MGLGRRADRRREAHRLAQVAGPVVDVLRLRVGEAGPGQGGHDGPARRLQGHRAHLLGKRGHRRRHHRGVEGVRGLQAPVHHTLHGEPLRHRRDRGLRACQHGGVRAVVGRQIDVSPDEWGHRLGTQAHRQHRACRLGLHQGATHGDQRSGVGQRHHLGQHGRHELAHAVAHQGHRLQATGEPGLRQRVLEGEDRRLGNGGGPQGLVVGAGQQGQQVRTPGTGHMGGHLLVGGLEDRIGLAQTPAHARVLRALAREHPDRLHRTRQALAGHPRGVGGIAQRLGCGTHAVGRHRQAVGKSAAAVLQRVGHVRQVQCRQAGVQQARRKTLGHGAERLGGAGREQQQLRAAGRAARSGHGRLVHDHMGIGAADTEAADPGQPGLAARPSRGLRRHLEGGALQPQGRVDLGDMQRGRQPLVVQGQRGLDQPGSTGGAHQVADVALDRTDAAVADIAAAGAMHRGEGFDLDRIAQGRGGAVGLDVAQRPRRHAGVVQRRLQHRGLAGDAGRGEAGLAAAIVVDGAAAEDGVDRIAIALGRGQRLEQHQGRAVVEGGARGVHVEGPGAPITRQHRALFVQMAHPVGDGDGRAAGQGQLASAGPQGVDRLHHRHQRGRAGGVDGHRRALQAQLVGQTQRGVVLVVGPVDRQLAQQLHELRPGEDVLQQVGRCADTGIDAHPLLQAIDGVAGLLQALPAQLQQHPLLRIQHLGLPQRHAKEGRVEVLHAVEHAPGSHVGRIGPQGGRHAGVKLVDREVGGAVDAGDQVAPEALHIFGPREPPGQADDGDGAVGLSLPGTAAGLRSRRGLGRPTSRARRALVQPGRQGGRAGMREHLGHGDPPPHPAGQQRRKPHHAQ